MRTTALTLSGISIIALISVPAVAQQVTGELGSPAATTTITGKQNSRRRRRPSVG